VLDDRGDMGLWIKAPGESDGDCGVGAGTQAGKFSPVIARNLITGRSQVAGNLCGWAARGVCWLGARYAGRDGWCGVARVFAVLGEGSGWRARGGGC